MKTIAELLEQALDNDPRLNQTAIAIATHSSQGAVSKWVHGLSTPSPEKCRGIADALNIPEKTVLCIAGHLSAIENISEPKPTYEYTPQDDDPTLLEIYHALKRLPPDQRRQVLEFVLFQLHRKDEPAPTASTTDTAGVATATT